MKTIKTLLFLIILINIFGCSSSKKKKSAEEQVLKLYNAIKTNNTNEIKLLYDSISNINKYYLSDTAIIVDIIIKENNDIIVKTVNKYTTVSGKKTNKDIIFYLKPDSINEFSYRIYDSKGICDFSDDITYEFAINYGCIQKQDTTDKMISNKIKIANDIIINKAIDIYSELEEYVYLTSFQWSKSYSDYASGDGIVRNSSQYDLPELKCKIVYTDCRGNEITTDDCIISYDKFHSGESKSFSFYTSYVGNANRAKVKFTFDIGTVMRYITSKRYTGEEYLQYLKDTIN